MMKETLRKTKVAIATSTLATPSIATTNIVVVLFSSKHQMMQ